MFHYFKIVRCTILKIILILHGLFLFVLAIFLFWFACVLFTQSQIRDVISFLSRGGGGG